MTPEKNPASPVVVMIDIETLSLKPTAHVTQFGLAVGNLDTQEVLLQDTAWMVRDQPLGKIDFETLAWWDTQDPAVKAGVFEPPTGIKRVTPTFLFDAVKDIVERYPECTVWGSPAMYDLPILTNMWGGKKPWKYNYERDMMTLYKLIDPTGELCPSENGKQHDAGADALWQLQYLFALHERLRLWKLSARLV